MSIQFLGMIGHRLASEIIPASGPLFDKNYIADFARAHEQAGFDRILVGYWSDQPDGFLVTAHAAAHTSRLKFLLAHRPGFVSPTLAARKLATLDNLTDGRLAVHIISGGSDSEQRRDGDYLDKAQRYARSDEFLTVLKQSLESDTPYDHQGEYYQAEQAFSAIKPQQAHLPVWFGGSSAEAIDVASRHADVFALWGEPLAGAAETVKTVRAAAARHNRPIKFNISFRPILGSTEKEAWERAEYIRETARQQLAASDFRFGKPKPQSVGAQRLLAAANLGDRLDKHLWTGIAKLVSGGYNSTALVGTPDQVSDALLDYYDLGIDNFLIRGFDPLNDAIEYGKALLPLTREKVAARNVSARSA
ncbi:LLM class flavin-dependent oxidoreductase [Erwiniaceae bacterium BAC15a-03b]|uniref:LLM class flavin-dependent oxidoreductase n=1 Tax=Winslowiella arboricola TaxID=2978220 RepID=A0A9J6PN98_9GAMM|nr:LLM class flavin-dependent oxidoreductase [Winslowiella arboricola]MCU5771367.1 LLM class flavin-dependent oxidoreductase [Winslowiella arboricola]MCU5777181.1 LLM class flavin-dependent oxidoreductase [Winslowiella arboricola]